MIEGTQGPPSAEWLSAAVEGILFAADEPATVREIGLALGGVEAAEIEAAIVEIEERYRGACGGLRVERVAGGLRLATKSEVGAWVRRFFRQRNRTRLSPAALETLAIVAYRQPITSPEIQAIRGKDPDAALRGLIERKLIRILGRKRVVGSPILYGTSRDFLIHFGLDRLEDLPSIEEFDRFLDVLESAQSSASGEADSESTERVAPQKSPIDPTAAAIADFEDGDEDSWREVGESA